MFVINCNGKRIDKKNRYIHAYAVLWLVAQSCLTRFNPMDCSPPGSSVHGVLQARILEWGAVPSSRALPHPGREPTSARPPALAGGFLTTSATWEARALTELSTAESRRHCFLSPF